MGSFVFGDGEKSLVWFIVLFVFILVCSLSLLDLRFTSTLLAVLVLFPDAPKGSCVCFGVWCPLLSAGGVSVPLWRFDSKNLIRPVRSGKPLGLSFSVTRPYVRVWHLKCLMGKQAS